MRIVAAVLGVLALATGLLSPAGAVGVATRTAPVLVSFVAVTMLAELAPATQVFDVAAVRTAGSARGRMPALIALVVVLGAVTTVALNLDITAVLITLVVLALAARLSLPFANLTSLLALRTLGLTTAGYARAMALPAVVAVVAMVLVFALWQRRVLAGRYCPPLPSSRWAPSTPYAASPTVTLSDSALRSTEESLRCLTWLFSR